MITNNLISEILFAFVSTHFISTCIISDDGKRVGINTATPTVKGKTTHSKEENILRKSLN